MDKKNILSVKNLKKIYSKQHNGKTYALNDLNLDVKFILNNIIEKLML